MSVYQGLMRGLPTTKVGDIAWGYWMGYWMKCCMGYDITTITNDMRFWWIWKYFGTVLLSKSSWPSTSEGKQHFIFCFCWDSESPFGWYMHPAECHRQCRPVTQSDAQVMHPCRSRDCKLGRSSPLTLGEKVPAYHVEVFDEAGSCQVVPASSVAAGSSRSAWSRSWGQFWQILANCVGLRLRSIGCFPSVHWWMLRNDSYFRLVGPSGPSEPEVFVDDIATGWWYSQTPASMLCCSTSNWWSTHCPSRVFASEAGSEENPKCPFVAGEWSGFPTKDCDDPQKKPASVALNHPSNIRIIKFISRWLPHKWSCEVSIFSMTLNHLRG